MKEVVDLMVIRADMIDHDYAPKRKGYMYEVFLGAHLFGRWREPVHNSLRKLLSGLSGGAGYAPVVRFFRSGMEHPDMIVNDLRAVSKHTVLESEGAGPKVVKYKPFAERRV